MSRMLFDRAQRYLGITEIAGEKDHPLIRWWHSLTTMGEATDEVPWCSSFVNGVCWDEKMDRTGSAAARSWLDIGESIELEDAIVGDIVILKRGSNPKSGHVGFYAGREGIKIRILGGNQGNTVSIVSFPKTRLLGVRRV